MPKCKKCGKRVNPFKIWEHIIEHLKDSIAPPAQVKGGEMSSLRERITKELNDWYEEPNWLAGDFPILADKILAAVAEWGEEECKEHGWRNLVERRLCRHCWEQLIKEG